MPYYKTKYVNGKIVLQDWTEQIEKITPWQRAVITKPNWTEQIETLKPYTESTAYFTGTKYHYYPSKQEKDTSKNKLADYNNALEINSVRDIVLGSFNPNMEHSTWFGEDIAKTPILNIIPNTLQHAYEHYLKPTFTGEANKALINLLTAGSETLDVVANPIKAVAITAVDGGDIGDIGKALLQSTFGDETGIHNFDWDTGNPAYDFLLELMSDPLNLVSFGGKVAVKITTKNGLEFTVDSTKFATKASRTRLAKELSQQAGVKITREQLEEAIQLTGKQYAAKMSTSMAVFRSDDIAKKGLTSSKIQAELLDAGKKKYTKLFTKNLDDITGASIKIGDKDAMAEAIEKYIKKVNDKTFLDLSTNVVSSLGYKAVKLENDISKSLLVSELWLSGVYPAFKTLKASKSAAKQYLTNRIMSKATANMANRILSARESFLKAGEYDGAFQVIAEELDLRVNYSDLKSLKEMADVAPQEIADYYATQIKLRIAAAMEALQDVDTPASVKRQEILNIFQSLDSHTPINSIDTVIKFIDDFEKEYAADLGKKLIDSPFSGLKRTLTEMKKQLNNLSKVEDARKFLDNNKALLKIAKDVDTIKALNSSTGFKYSVKTILDRLPKTRLYAAVQDFPVRSLENLIEAPKAQKEILDNITIEIREAIIDLLPYAKDLPDEDGFRYVLELIDNLMKMPIKQGITTEYVETIKDLISAVNIIKTKYSAKDYGKILSPKYFEVLFPEESIEDIFSVHKLNKPLIEALEKVPETTAKLDFTQTKLYRTSYNLLKQETNNLKLIKGTSDTVHKLYSNITEVRVKQTEDLIKKISEITGLEKPKSVTEFKYTYKENLIDAINKIKSENNILSPARMRDLDKNLKTLEQFLFDSKQNVNYFKSLYFSSPTTIMEDLKTQLNDFKLLLLKITRIEDEEKYSILYKALHDTHHKLFLTFERVKKYFNDIDDLKKYPITSDLTESNGVIKRVYRDAITGTVLDELDVKRIPEFRPDNPALKFFKSKVELQDALKAMDSKDMRDALKMLDDLEDFLLRLNPEAYESKALQIQQNTWYARIKLENTLVQNQFDDLPALKKLFEDPDIRSLTDTVINTRSSNSLKKFFEAQGYNEATQRVLISLAVLHQSITNRAKAFILMDEFVNSLGLTGKQKAIALAAAHTTMFYTKYKDVYDISAETLAKEFGRHLENYINAVDPTLKKKSMDKLLTDYAEAKGITLKQVEKEILEEIANIPDIDLKHVSRHSALYDAVAQVKVYNQLHPDEPFFGYMLDTETTKLLDNYGRTNGRLTELAVIFVDENGTITAPFNKAIQVSRETYKNYYALSDDVLASLGYSKKEWAAKYITNADTYLEKDMLYDFYKFLRINMQQDIPVSTFNGDNFDWKFIAYRITEELGLDDIADQIKQVNPRDIYAELTKDRYKLTDLELVKLTKVFEDIINTQRQTLGKFRNYVNFPIKVTMGMDNSFIDNIKELLDLKTLKSLETKSVSHNMDDLLMLNGYVDDGALIDRFAEVIEASENLKIYKEIFKNDIDPYLKEHLYNISKEYVQVASDIKYINQSLKDVVMSSISFDELHPEFNKEIHNRLNELARHFIEELPNSKYKKHLLKNFQGVNNITELLALGSDTDPMIAFRKYDGNKFALWDLHKFPVDTNTVERTADIIETVIKKNNNLYNVESLIPYSEEIYTMLEQIKSSYLTRTIGGLKVDPDNLQYSYSVLDYFITHLHNLSESTSPARLGAERLLKTLQKEHPDLYQFIEDGTAFVRVSVEGNNLNFIKPSTVKWGKQIDETMELVALKDFSKRNISSIKSLLNTTKNIQKAMGRPVTAGTLWQSLIDAQTQNIGKTGFRLLKNTGYQTTHVRFAYHLHNILSYKNDPQKLLSEILYSNKDHVLTILKPQNNKYFNNLDNYKVFLQNTEALEEAGIKVIKDRVNDRIILGLDKSKLKITYNKNKWSKAKYCINGIEIEPNTMPELPYNVYKAYVSGPNQYTEDMYKWLRYLEEMAPEMKGRSGITNYYQQYEDLKSMNTFREYDYSTMLDGDNYMPFMNQAYVGEYEEVIKDLGPLSADALYLYGNPASKITNHLGKHFEYAQFIYDGGIRLDSDVMQKMNPKELTKWLNENPNFVAVYLADAKRAVGGFELRRISSFNETTLKEAKRLKATIVPYEQYVRAANMINNYTYESNFGRIFGKLATLYKKSFLLNPGVLVRNIIDSAMKNYIEGESIPDTTMNYIKATDLYQKYTKVMHEIQNMDVNKHYRLQNAIDYFAQGDRLLDSDTYHFIYNFMNENGMNTLQTSSSDLFDWAMKPMSYVEKINRLTQYLILEDQGLEYSEIIRKIAQTHFDYSIKTQADFITQIYIPFWTYASNNIDYTLHLINDHPSFLRNYFNVYTPIWDFDAMNYEELEQNTSLQAQIINGNIPLSIFGYEDKEFTRQIETKYGVQTQTVKNTATLKLGSSILDGLNFFVSPYNYIKEKLAPPYQTLADTITNFGYAAYGNDEEYSMQDFFSAEADYQRNFGSTTIPALFKDPTKLVELVPGLNVLKQRYTYTDGLGEQHIGTSVGYRTQNNILGAMPSVFGATSRWGTFAKKTPKTYEYPKQNYNYNYSRGKRYYGKRVYHKKVYPGTPRVNQGMTYRFGPYGQGYAYYTGYTNKTYPSGKQPYSKYKAFIAQIQKPNYTHRATSSNISGNMQSIPQYLYSYMGKNRQGKSKLLSWIRMNTEYKVKSTLRRYASP